MHPFPLHRENVNLSRKFKAKEAQHKGSLLNSMPYKDALTESVKKTEVKKQRGET